MTGSVVAMSELTTVGWPHRLLTLDDWNALDSDGRYRTVAEPHGRVSVEVCGVACEIDLDALGRI